MKMNDDFIYRALPKVRKDFAQSLYTKISAAPRRGFRPGTYSMRRIPYRLQVALIVLGVLILVAWSQMRFWIRYVAIGDLWLIEFSLTQPGLDVETVKPVHSGSPSSFGPDEGYLVPDWIPEGFSPTQIPGAGYSYENSIGMWSNDAEETIRLFAVPKAGGARPYAPPGMYKEVEVKGQPAILIYGRLAPNSPADPQAQRKWDKTLGLQLSWSLGEGVFTLETLGPYVTEEDLIQMAESMKKGPTLQETTETTIP
jgi:hypothetical protein